MGANSPGYSDAPSLRAPRAPATQRGSGAPSDRLACQEGAPGWSGSAHALRQIGFAGIPAHGRKPTTLLRVRDDWLARWRRGWRRRKRSDTRRRLAVADAFVCLTTGVGRHRTGDVVMTLLDVAEVVAAVGQVADGTPVDPVPNLSSLTACPPVTVAIVSRLAGCAWSRNEHNKQGRNNGATRMRRRMGVVRVESDGAVAVGPR